MKSKSVNPQYRPYSQGNPSQVIFTSPPVSETPGRPRNGAEFCSCGSPSDFTRMFILYLDMVHSSLAKNVNTRVAWMFSWRMKNACKTAWVVHASKIRVTGLAIYRPSWDFRNRSFPSYLVPLLQNESP